MTQKKFEIKFLQNHGSLRTGLSGWTPWLLLVFFAIVIVGLVSLYSATTDHQYFYAQLKRLVIALALMGSIGFLVPTRLLYDWSNAIFLLTVIVLGFVLILGSTAGGSQRWIYIGPIGIQPSEFAKISCALVVARFFQLHPKELPYSFYELVPIGLGVGTIFFLIFQQPDLGTAGICVLIALTQLFFIRIDTNHIKWALAAGLGVAAIAWTFLLRDYQKGRILTVLNPNLDPQGSGYNSIQSMVAIGSGGFSGRGFLQGSQSKLQFLPARHTDFIFSVFAEEWGFIGCFIVVALFATICLIILDIAKRAPDTFSSLLTIGIGALFFVEFMINVAMVLGIFPVVGMPLPFVSYGGSSLLAMSIAMGILIGIDRSTSKRRQFAPSVS